MNLSEFRDLTAYAESLGFPYRLFIVPTLFERIVERLTHVDDPDAEHLAVMRLAVPLSLLARFQPSQCRFTYALTSDRDDLEPWEIPVAATFHEDAESGYFLLDFGSVDQLKPNPQRLLQARRARMQTEQ